MHTTSNNTLPENRKQPFRLYVGILIALVLCRWAQLVAASMGWQFDSADWGIGLTLLACIFSVWWAWYAEDKIPRLIVWMSCVLFGGFVTGFMTEAFSPLPGAALASIGGGLTLWRGHALRLLPSKPDKSVSPIRLYLGLFLAVIAGRWIQMTGLSVGWQFDVSPWPLTFVLFACISTGWLGWYLHGRLPKLIVWMWCIVGGGFVTALMNPIPGVIIGFCVGGFTLVPRFTTRVLLPSVLLGITGGILAGWLWLFELSGSSGSLQLWAFAVPPVCCVILLLAVLWRLNRPITLRWLLCSVTGVALLLLATLVALPLYLNYRMDLIRNSVLTVPLRAAGANQLGMSLAPSYFMGGPRPLLDHIDGGLKLLGMQPALGLATTVSLDIDSSHADIERLSKIPFVTNLYVRAGCKITDTEFHAINTRGLCYVTCEDKTQLTDAAFENVDFSKVQSLTLNGPNFGDGIAKELTDIPFLATISLDGTNVTADGLKHVDNTGMLLWLLLPNSTQLDDEVFSILDRHNSLWRVNLNGTPIDGSGIKNFRSFIRILEMNDTKFDTQYLTDLLAPEGEPANPDNCLHVDRLSIANAKSDDELMSLLTKIKKPLKFLDVAGSDLTVPQLAKLGLGGYGIDAERVTPTNIGQLVKLTELRLHYDGNRMTVDEILAHYESIQPIASGGLWVVIRNLKMDKPSFKKLQRIQPQIQIKDAQFPDGKVLSFEYINQILTQYDFGP